MCVLDKSLYNVQQCVKVLRPFAQTCILQDEMSLQANMYNDCGKDSVVSLEDFDNRQRSFHDTNSISSGFDNRRAYLQIEAAS